VGNTGDGDKTLALVDRIDDAVVADADSVIVAAGELDRSHRPRIACEAINCGADALLGRSL
jgi:hypothetical protein